MGRSQRTWSPPLVGEGWQGRVSLWVQGALALLCGLDIADSPGTVADIRGLNAAWVGLATRARGRAQGAGALAGKRATGTSLVCPTVRALDGCGGRGGRA